MIVLVDLNSWIGDQKGHGIISAFEVEGENKNGRKVIDFCVDRDVLIIISLITRIFIIIGEIILK